MGASGRICTCVEPLRTRLPHRLGHGSFNHEKSRAPVLPRVPPRSKRGGFADSLARDVMKIGGLCGHCSRDLPLDKRLLFVAELTGQ